MINLVRQHESWSQASRNESRKIIIFKLISRRKNIIAKAKKGESHTTGCKPHHKQLNSGDDNQILFHTWYCRAAHANTIIWCLLQTNCHTYKPPNYHQDRKKLFKFIFINYKKKVIMVRKEKSINLHCT